jgi:hypothetical protein
MTKRLLYFTALLCFAATLRASPPIGAVVQTWHYDPQAKIVTIRLVNTTQKDILAWDLAITETFADGSTSSHNVMTDILDRILNAQAVKGTTEEAGSTQRFGNGTFAASAGFDQDIPEPKAVTNMLIVVDMVAYADRTAEVVNEGAFEQLTAYRQGQLLAMQQANEVMQRLADPGQAAAELNRRIIVLRTQNLASNDPLKYEDAHLQEAVSTLEYVQHSGITGAEYLKKDVARRQQRIALVGPHAQLTKTRGEGQ